MKEPSVEILYLAWNRLQFTSQTWRLLMCNTNWKLVKKLTVYDDGSEDGTLEFLREHIGDCPVEAELRLSDMRSPPAIMNHFLATERTELFFKLDNDICCPRKWLDIMLSVMRDNPEIDLLGVEPGMAEPDSERVGHGFQPSSHIGGVGLMRTKFFTDNPPIPERGRFGFGDIQDRYNPVRGWITPDLMMPQLDRVPIEPWKSLSAEYVRKGWQRNWPSWEMSLSQYWDWMPK